MVDYRKITDMLLVPVNLIVGPVAVYSGWQAYIDGQLLYAIVLLLCGIVVWAYTAFLARQFMKGRGTRR